MTCRAHDKCDTPSYTVIIEAAVEEIQSWIPSNIRSRYYSDDNCALFGGEGGHGRPAIGRDQATAACQSLGPTIARLRNIVSFAAKNR